MVGGGLCDEEPEYEEHRDPEEDLVEELILLELRSAGGRWNKHQHVTNDISVPAIIRRQQIDLSTVLIAFDFYSY